MSFEFTETGIPDVILVEPSIHSDSRGFFVETYKKSEFARAGIAEDFVQDNYSLSRKYVLRGLHYQLMPKGQGKLVRVVSGRIFDVVVDLRSSSPTFGKWISFDLSRSDHNMLWIPVGFAHGFLSLDDDTKVLYKTTSEYDINFDRGIRWNDPKLGINWPKLDPTISEKDAKLPFLRDAEINFEYIPRRSGK